MIPKKVKEVVVTAKAQVGKPYLFGGDTPKGFDCSGLVKYAYEQHGVELPHNTVAQYNKGRKVKHGLRQGDAVFFRGAAPPYPDHEGMYVGDGFFVEAPHTGAKVRVSKLAGYPGYMGARRYVHWFPHVHVVNPALLVRMKLKGIVYPLATVQAAQVSKLGLPLACAMLWLESGGGHNEFGHDSDSEGPCPGCGWGEVTEAKYLKFRELRDAQHRSNGVGPAQLTSVSLQNEADAAGGCWVPKHNMAVGFHYLHDLIQEFGLEQGCVHYNGSGPLADAYGQRLLATAEAFKKAKCGNLVGIY
jgi:NlpC/P60 family